MYVGAMLRPLNWNRQQPEYAFGIDRSEDRHIGTFREGAYVAAAVLLGVRSAGLAPLARTLRSAMGCLASAQEIGVYAIEAD